MATKLSLILDAAQYQQQLAAVVRQTRQAAAQMDALNVDRTVPVTADTTQAERALSDLSDRSDLSTKSITVTADTKPAEQAIANLPEAQDQAYTITGQLSAPEIPQAQDQVYTVTGQLNAPEIPEAPDQAYEVTGTANPPDVPQVPNQQYTVTADTTQAERALSTLSTLSTKSITVTADTKPAEQAIANLPEAQNQAYTITGQLNAPVIPQAQDQAYTVTGQLNAPEIPQAEDQAYTITGQLNAPNVPQAQDQAYTITGQLNAPEIPQAADQAYTITGQLNAPVIPQAKDQVYTVTGLLNAPEIPQAQDQAYTITGSVNAPEIPQAQDQAYTVTGKVNAPEIPQAEDQAYTVTGQLNAPEIPQAQDQQFTVSADTAPAERALSTLSTPSTKSITVTADTTQAENALYSIPDHKEVTITIPEVKPVSISVIAETVKIAELKALEDKELTAQVKVVDDQIALLQQELDQIQSKDITVTTQADLEQVETLKAVIAALQDKKIQIRTEVHSEQLDKLRSDLAQVQSGTGTVAAPPDSVWKRTSAGIRDCWKEMTNLDGGAKKFITTMVAGGGLIGVVLAGVQSVIKLCTAAYDAMVQAGKDAADAHRDAADELGRAAAQTDRLKASTTDIISQLSGLASAEKLSNAEREKAVSLIAQLTRQYGELGVSVDDTTGRINNLGSAIVAIQEKNSRRKIQSIEARLKELRDARDQEDQNVSDAGLNLGKINKAASWFSVGGIINNLSGQTERNNSDLGLDQIQIGGEQAAKDAAERRKKTDKKIRELEMQRHEEKKILAQIAKKQLEETRIQTAALAEQKIERDKQAKYRSADAEYGRMKYAEDKIANRQSLITGEQAENAKLRERTAAAKSNMDQYAPGTKNADAQKYADAQKAYLQAAAEQAKSDEKIAGWQNQIKQLQYEQAEAKKRMTEQAAYELEYNRLIIAGEFDKAEALKLENELKAQGLKLTQAEKDAILEQRKAMKRQQSKQMVDDAKQQVELNRMLLNGDYEAYEAEKLRIEAKQKGLNLTEEETREILKQRELLKQQRLQVSNRDKAQDLKWQFMEKTGRGKEASEQRALRDAERTKGSKLTDSEIAATKKLHELTWKMQNMRDPQFGDLDIKTNSLTARGGFQGAAYVPDTEKYNRQIAQANQSMLSVLQRIESMCRDLNKF